MNGKRVAVIGAGASGLVTAKSLIEEGHNPVIYEKQPFLGGIWKYREEPGGVYEEAYATSSKGITAFSDYRFPPSTPLFPQHKSFFEYLNGFADRFGLKERIRFNQKIRSVSKNGDKWLVETEDGASDAYDAVVVCSGLNSNPNLPQIEGADQFQGEILHCENYKNRNAYKGKRVLIVGCGETGAEIAAEVATTAEQTYLCVNRGVAFVHRRARGQVPTDSYDLRIRDTLPHSLRYWMTGLEITLLWGDRGHGIKTLRSKTGNLRSRFFNKGVAVLNEISNGRVIPVKGLKKLTGDSAVFESGEEVKVDTVLLATGYRVNFPFLNDFDLYKTPLYKGVVYPDDPSLAFIGLVRPRFGAILPIAEIQARWYSMLLSEPDALPSQEERTTRAANFRKKWHLRYNSAGQHLLQLVDFAPYLNEVGGEMRVRPRLWRLLLKDPVLWWHVATGVYSSTHFRIEGRHSLANARETIIKENRNYPQVFFAYKVAQILLSSLLSLPAIAYRAVERRVFPT